MALHPAFKNFIAVHFEMKCHST